VALKIGRRKLFIGAACLVPAKSLAWSHGISAFSPQSQQFFDRLLTPPSEALASYYSAFTKSLVTAGIWQNLDVLALYATQGSDASLINLSQSSFQEGFDTISGNMTFASNVGWTGGGAPGQNDINTFFNPSAASANYSQNNAMFCTWQIGGNAATGLIADSANDNAILLAPLQGGNIDWAINGNGALVSTANSGDGSGFWLAQRTGTNSSAIYRNGALAATSTNVSAALTNSDIVVGTSTASSGNSVAAFACGAALTAGQITALYDAMFAYLRAVGAI
jgi:hypothetical protein